MCLTDAKPESAPDQLERVLEGVMDDQYAIIQLCDLILKVTDVESIDAGTLEGVSRVIRTIKKHGEAVCDANEAARHLAHQCA